jgi:hypothetical protein
MIKSVAGLKSGCSWKVLLVFDHEGAAAPLKAGTGQAKNLLFCATAAWRSEIKSISTRAAR